MAHNLATVNFNQVELFSIIRAGVRSLEWGRASYETTVLRDLAADSSTEIGQLFQNIANHRYIDIQFANHATNFYRLSLDGNFCSQSLFPPPLFTGRGNADPINPSHTTLQLVVNGVPQNLPNTPAALNAFILGLTPGQTLKFTSTISVRNRMINNVPDGNRWFTSFTSIKALAAIVKELAIHFDWLQVNIEGAFAGIAGLQFVPPVGAAAGGIGIGGIVIPDQTPGAPSGIVSPVFIANLQTFINNCNARFNTVLDTNGGACLTVASPTSASTLTNPILDDELNYTGKFQQYCNEVFDSLFLKSTNKKFYSNWNGANPFVPGRTPTTEDNFFTAPIIISRGWRQDLEANEGHNGTENDTVDVIPDTLLNRFIFAVREMIHYDGSKGPNQNQLLTQPLGTQPYRGIHFSEAFTSDTFHQKTKRLRIQSKTNATIPRVRDNFFHW